MRYLLDTNIISNITRTSPSESLLAWMAEQNDDDLYISSLTVAEIRRGGVVGASRTVGAMDGAIEPPWTG